MPTSRSIVVRDQGSDLDLTERDIPDPSPGHVRVRVKACGVCHSDSFAKEGGYPGVAWPITPGHEVAGTIEAIGAGVHGWEEGQRVGVGWFGGNCGWCDPCRRGDLFGCLDMGIPGVTMDGGYAEHIVVRGTALAAIPDSLTDEDAAPLLCAGITTFNALRHSQARPGDLVAILGVGGLGHLGVQYAAKMGFETVAIARGRDKEELAKRCGAHRYIDSTAADPAAALNDLGGATVVLSTITAADAVTTLLGGLRPQGQMVLVGAATEAVQVVPAAAVGGGLSVIGHASGTAKDSEDTLRFSALTGVRPMIETRPLEEAQAAYERMMAGDARFRMVLTT